MAASSPNRDSADTGDCSSKAKFTLSPSEGCSSCEDDSSCEDRTLRKDIPSTLCSSDNQVPRLWDMSGTDGVKDQIIQHDQVQGDPQQFGKQGFAMAWANDDGLEESTNNENQNSHKGNQTNYEDHVSDVFEPTPVEDFRLCNCSSSPMAQVRHQEHSLMCSSPEEGGSPVPEMPPMPRGRYCAKLASKTTRSQESGVTGTSRTSWAQPEDEDACFNMQSCLKMGQMFRWLQRKIRAALRRREDPEKATKSYRYQALRRLRLRNNRIEPEEALG
ncbi:uncharacterized protein C12orf71 homolog [Heterocephalus glaber]|uniref:Uncharacterized protein C12orf71 homolog n=1 Tax=Heterocephalus glaber TaxID=10181 RepID=A0AAX6S7Z7_HETGA|nr:uncharacterized protein C12orf71 homolog [Heterocephalus glaber]